MFNTEKPGEDGTILWNVVEQHLEEGAFSFRRWAHALDSPNETIQSVRDKYEERLKAHVDGLFIGGESVAKRALEPELKSPPDPQGERCAVAALALLEQGSFEPVREALSSGLPEVRAGVERALAMVGSPQVGHWLRSELPAMLPATQRASLLRIASARRIVLPHLLESLQSANPEEAAAAASASRQSNPALHAGAIEHLLSSAHSGVRDSALETALVWGGTAAFQRCLALAGNELAAHPMPMMLVALLGDGRHHERLLSHLSRPSHIHAAIRALGFAGYVSHVSHLLPHAASKDALIAKLAGEAIFNITGIAAPTRALLPAESPSLPAFEEDDLDADLVPGQEDALPVPDAAALSEMWRVAVRNLSPNHRLLQGQPWTVPRALECLSVTTMRQRHSIALWLRIRSGGGIDLETRAATSHQLALLQRLHLTAVDAHLVNNFWGT